MAVDALDHLTLLYAARDALIERASHAAVTGAAERLRAAVPNDPLVPLLEAKARRIVVIDALLANSIVPELSDSAQV
jgi:hypothetical protein